MPNTSPREQPSLLIAAVSARALARAARRAGFIPLVADFFADLDTQELAHGCRKLSDLKRGMRWAPLRNALSSLAKRAPSPVLGVVCGAGFEDRPDLLARIAKRWTLLGNDAATIERVKDAEQFFSIVQSLGIAHPKTTTRRPKRESGWLAKRRGGAGGSHVRQSRGEDGPETYYQRQVEGRAVSALFVANGERARVLGFSEQWTAPSKRSPWRYCGAAQPASLSPTAKGIMSAAVEQLAGAFQLKGLGSADFLLGDAGPLLLEINPRPGATLDIFDSDSTPLLKLHVDAVMAGKLPRLGLKLEQATAAAIVYAPEALIVPEAMEWPDWAADRPRPRDRIDKSRPICTVWARAATGARARALAQERIIKILSILRDLTKGTCIGQGLEEGRDGIAPGGLAERQH